MDRKGAILGLILVAFLLLHNFAFADLPPPQLSVYVHVTHDGEEVPDPAFDAVLLSRHDVEPPPSLIPELDIIVNESSRNCSYSPYKVDQCQDSECYFIDFPYAYGLENEYYDCILAVYLPSVDQVFLSDTFYVQEYRGNYFDANLISSGTIILQKRTEPEVEEEVKKLSLKLFVRTLFLTLLFELIVAYIFCFFTKIPKKVLLSVILANIISVAIVSISLPIVFTFLHNNVTNDGVAGLVEIVLIFFTGVAIFAFETCFIYLFNKQIITLKRSSWLSLLMNLTSYILGQFTIVTFFLAL